MPRNLPCSPILCLLFAASALTSTTAADIKQLEGFLQAHCYDCHDADVQKAQLNFEALMRGGSPEMADAAKWETALDMIAKGEMPPKKRKQPTQAERDLGSAAIEALLSRWTASLGENPGRVTARRLNREEYNNTIRDLVGVDFRPADDFPRDEVGYGFDNIGDVLSLSPVLMEKYLDAGEQIAEKAIVADLPEWPPAMRPALKDFQLLSWESSLLRLPLAGTWSATFLQPGKSDAVTAPLTFSPTANVSKIIVEGKRVKFVTAIDIDGTPENFSVTAEERGTGRLVGQWISGPDSGTFEARALPGPAFAGNWQAVATLPDGRDIEQDLTLTAQDDGVLGGRIVARAEDRRSELDEVHAEEESLRFAYGIQFENSAMDVKVRAHLHDDGYLRGKWVLVNGSQEEVATGDWGALRPEPDDQESNVRLIGSSIGMLREGEARLEFHADKAGDYRLDFSSYQNRAGLENALLGLFVDGKELERIDIPWEEPQPQSRTLSFSAGKHSIGLAYLNNYVDNQTRDRKLRGDRNLYVKDVEIVGPLDLPRPTLPDSHRRIIPQQPEPGTEKEAARRWITEFASRAYRRPASAEEVERIASLVDASLADGETFGEGMRLACQAVLVSPHFLFRWELDSARHLNDDQAIRNLNAYEIASRLSYFLWSSMPDDQLFSLAMDGSLLDGRVIRTQVQRMLADKRSEALVRNFAGQWLQIRNLNSVEPDPETFPEFDADLRSSMAEETYLFFNAILREDRSVLELLDADFTFLNKRLATHYGLEAEHLSDAFERVSLPADSNRGGVLTQASVLTITSNPRRTSGKVGA
ncbi:MAG: DUF1592 domain-containing protein [Verrucomicrobia bacterium]|nr:DUF1592 domain-containing protein [Verrucomicrobiota bacterium]